MKKNAILFSTLIIGACVAQAQTQSGGGVQSGAGRAAPSPGTGQRQATPGTRTGIQGPNQAGQIQAGQAGTVQPGTGVQQSGAVNTSTNWRAGGIGANPTESDRQRILLQQPQPFGGTNPVGFGGTNTTAFAPTNRAAFGGTNVISALGTNAVQPPIAGNGTIINDASGAANQNGTFINGAAGATNGLGQLNAAGNQSVNNTESVFNQRLRAALLQTGATRIYFPQTRSTVNVANQNGTVVLTGTVSSEAERQSIEAQIRQTQGVITIDNQLKLLAAGAPGTNRVSTPGNNDQRVRFP